MTEQPDPIFDSTLACMLLVAIVVIYGIFIPNEILGRLP